MMSTVRNHATAWPKHNEEDDTCYTTRVNVFLVRRDRLRLLQAVASLATRKDRRPPLQIRLLLLLSPLVGVSISDCAYSGHTC